ncbi:MAG: DUF1343 domain-containing protein [Candidatus Aminicenantales bacterium]
MRKETRRRHVILKLIIFLTVCMFSLFVFSAARAKGDKDERAIRKEYTVKLGVEVFLEKHISLIKGKRVGLITNPSGVDSQLQSTAERFFRNPDIQLVALYGPEHGVRGNAQAGEYVPFYIDEKYKIPVFSLYGQSRKADPGMLKNIDAYMRSFDTVQEGKIPERTMIRDVDVLVFDIQDVGTRIYAYIATMVYAMEAAAENDIDFIVLDRPNPINGRDMEGPILEYPEFSSFLGVYPIPFRHGMTVGEQAKMYNEKFLSKKARLTVIPMEGWKREMWYDETGLPWVIPSPNMPTLETATVYSGQVFLEGTNVSEGRGTTKPFELFGAPWIDGYALAKKLNELDLLDVKFREAWFTPTFSKFQGELCSGAQIHVLDRNIYRPLETALFIIQTIRAMYPNKFQFHQDYFDTIMGTAKVREAILRGIPIRDIFKEFAEGLEAFSSMRKAYLLY